MSGTVELSARASSGALGQYIALLTGRDKKVHFSRQFLGSKEGKHKDRTVYETDEPGIYECCDRNKKGKSKRYYLVLDFQGDLTKVEIPLRDALVLVRRVEGGELLEELVELSTEEGQVICSVKKKAEVKKAKAAGDLATAVEAIVFTLQALPTHLQRKAIAEAKRRLFPKT